MVNCRYIVGEPMLLGGKHRCAGETTEPMEETKVMADLCKKGTLVRVWPTSSNTSILEELRKGDEEIARGNSRLYSDTSKKKGHK